MEMRTTRDMIIRTTTLARSLHTQNGMPDLWRAERYRLAGLIWAEVGPIDAHGQPSLASATQIAAHLATGKHNVSEIDSLYRGHGLVSEFDRWLAGFKANRGSNMGSDLVK